jgi:hypothetical protein
VNGYVKLRLWRGGAIPVAVADDTEKEILEFLEVLADDGGPRARRSW